MLQYLIYNSSWRRCVESLSLSSLSSLSRVPLLSPSRVSLSHHLSCHRYIESLSSWVSWVSLSSPSLMSLLSLLYWVPFLLSLLGLPLESLTSESFKPLESLSCDHLFNKASLVLLSRLSSVSPEWVLSLSLESSSLSHTSLLSLSRLSLSRLSLSRLSLSRLSVASLS